MELFENLRKKSIPITKASSLKSREYIFDILKATYGGHTWSDTYTETIKSSILIFSLLLVRKWKASKSTLRIFKKNNNLWLQNKFELPCNTTSEKKNVGRPKKCFAECSTRSKQRKSAALGNLCTTPEMQHAAKSKFYKSGNRALADVLKIATSTPQRANKIKKSFDTKKSIVPYTAEEALGFILDNKLNKQQYINIRCEAKKRNADIYPAYEYIIEAKKKCYPENCRISDVSCSVPLQDLLNHTTNRIISVTEITDIEDCNEFEMIYKWGCDGSSSNSQYKQSFKDTNVSDISVFTVSLVPLRLQCIKSNQSFIFWSNPRYSSTRFCRPIKFLYMKEMNDKTREIYAEMEYEIKNLSKTLFSNDTLRFEIKHTLIFSMIDGKVIIILSV